jgi:hypothetical protein
VNDEPAGTIASDLLDRIQRWAMLCAAVGIVLCLVALVNGTWRRWLVESYLWSYLFFLGVTLGSIAIVMLHNVTGGAWGVVARQFLLSAGRLVPLMLLMFIPVLLGMKHLYAWMNAAEVAHDRILQHKSPYLNFPFFLVRLLVYFAVWIGLALLIHGWLVRQDRARDPERARRVQRVSGIGLILYGLTVTFASVDWVMSLERHWFSTIFGFLFIVGQTLSTIAFVIVIVAILHARRPLSDLVTRGHFQDLGNLLLTFVILWAYISFSQYLIIWSGNVPEEVTWYTRRMGAPSLRLLALALILLHFFLPFALLLSRKTKNEIGTLAAVALLVIVMRCADLFWIVAPSFEHRTTRGGWLIKWTDLAAPLAVGGTWLTLYVWQLRGRPLLLRASPEDLETSHGHG